FLAEIERESSRQKFTFAELEENEQDLHRLETWLERISQRDFTGGSLSGQVAETLERCRTALETFSSEVYNRQAAGSDASAPGEN
ncbi:MAG TPA: Chromate resistance protein ChrB, partial [Anaerolineaceae bacterium]